MTRNIIDIDLDSCIGCHSCAVVCKQENNVGLGTFYNKVLTVGPSGTYPDLEMYYLPVACQHCDEPQCVEVCPTGASYKREDGVVLVDHSKCIGCQYCVMACPYGVRTYDTSKDKGVIEKCTMCAPHRQGREAGLREALPGSGPQVRRPGRPPVRRVEAARREEDVQAEGRGEPSGRGLRHGQVRLEGR